MTTKLGLLTATAIAGLAMIGPAKSAVLFIQVSDNGTLIGSSPISTFGVASFMDTTAPDFSSISVTANGPPILPNADLSTVTLDISTASGFTGTHNLTIDVFQTGVSAAAGTSVSTTFSVNNLIGTPGPAVLSDFINGTGTTLGSQLETHTFPVGTIVDKVGPLNDVLSTALTADAAQYMITFTSTDQSANDTIQLKTTTPSVPEPASLLILGAGLVGLGLARCRIS